MRDIKHMNIVKKEEKIMYENKKIFILGMARSGYEVAKVLAKHNNQLMICDKQKQDEDKICELVDVDARPEHLVQFAQMGSVYFENVMGKKNPTVGIVNIGTEEEKGNQLVKETYPLLRDCKNINFVGSVEARDIAKGGTDILVCEAFVGNVILKFFEGVAKTFLGCIKEGIMKSLRTKIGGMLIKPALKGLLKTFDVSSQGGAPLLGLKGLVVKAHGNSKSAEI